MSVTKIIVSRGTKATISSPERISVWFTRFILGGLIFFAILSSTHQYIDTNNFFIYFLYLGAVFFITDFLSFFLSYAVVKLLFGILLNRKIRSLAATIKYRRRIKKLWIYVFILMYEIIFFMSFETLADKLPLPIYLAYILAWIGLWISAKLISRILYFLFYDF